MALITVHVPRQWEKSPPCMDPLGELISKGSPLLDE